MNAPELAVSERIFANYNNAIRDAYVCELTPRETARTKRLKLAVRCEFNLPQISTICECSSLYFDDTIRNQDAPYIAFGE